MSDTGSGTENKPELVPHVKVPGDPKRQLPYGRLEVAVRPSLSLVPWRGRAPVYYVRVSLRRLGLYHQLLSLLPPPAFHLLQLKSAYNQMVRSRPEILRFILHGDG